MSGERAAGEEVADRCQVPQAVSSHRHCLEGSAIFDHQGRTFQFDQIFFFSSLNRRVTVSRKAPFSAPFPRVEPELEFASASGFGHLGH